VSNPPRTREPDDGRPASEVDAIEVSTVPHGAVAVFQAPRPRTAAADQADDWDEISSPFLDLVGTPDEDNAARRAADAARWDHLVAVIEGRLPVAPGASPLPAEPIERPRRVAVSAAGTGS